MNKNQVMSLVGRYAVPALVTVCGLVLVFSPDSASILVSRVLSVILMLCAICCVVTAFFGSEEKVRQLLMAAGAFFISRWLSANPLGLAAGLSRILGICLLLAAAGGFWKSTSQGGKVLSIGEGILGAILILLPLFASRLVFTICGVAVTAVGITMLVKAYRQNRYLSGGKGGIIDAL